MTEVQDSSVQDIKVQVSFFDAHNLCSYVFNIILNLFFCSFDRSYSRTVDSPGIGLCIMVVSNSF